MHPQILPEPKMSPRHGLMLLWEEFDNLAGRFEIDVVGITGWVAPLLRRAHPVSQMAYPRENVIWPGCNVLQLPEPRGKTFAVISTTTSLYTPSTRRKIEIMSYSTALKSFFYGCSSFFAGLDAGWLWLAAPPTSRNARLLPLWFSKLSRLRAKMAPEWASPAFVLRRPLSQDGGQHGRPAGAQFLNLLQRVCVQPVPRKRQPPTPQNLTSAFPLTSILSTYRLFICHSPETGAANLLRFDCHGWTDVFPHTGYQKGGRLRIPVIPKFPWAFREVPQQGEWYLAIHRKGVTGVCDFIRSFSPDQWQCFDQRQRWWRNDPIIAIFLKVRKIVNPGLQVESTQVWSNEQSARCVSDAPYWSRRESGPTRCSILTTFHQSMRKCGKDKNADCLKILYV